MPRRNRRARGPAPPALFTWGPHASDIQPDQPRDNPRARPCPRCQATTGERCTRPGRGGRVPIDGYHDSRRTPPTQVDQQTPETPPSGAAHAPGDPNR